MSRGRHALRRGRGWVSVAIFVGLGLLLLSAAGSAVAAYRYDRATVNRILPGVKIAGIDVGGMTRSQATAAVAAYTDKRLSQHLVIHAGGRTWDRALADLGLSADVAGVVDEAFHVADGYSWMSRVYHRLTNNPVNGSLSVLFSQDEGPVKEFVRKAFLAMKVEPTNAGIVLEGGQPSVQHSEPGRALKSWVARRMLAEAVQKRASEVTLPMKALQPEVTDETLGKTLTVNLSTNTLQLYDGFDVERTYPVATAMYGFETPTGTWQVINKVEWPTWYNPAPDGWGAGEPLVIPPGPSNPLGTRALYLDAPGIRIHGTPSDSSIGTYASHGCIRMHIPDSEALYPLVPIGTTVLIYGAPPWGNVSNPGAPG